MTIRQLAPMVDVLRSRLARRFLGLFVLSALLPLVLMAVLTERQMIVIKSEQTRQQLSHDSQMTGVLILERLQVAGDVLRTLGIALDQSLVSKAHPIINASKQFDALAVWTETGQTITLSGQLPMRADWWPSEQVLFRAELQEQALDSKQTIVLMSIQLPDNRILIGKLDDDYLWLGTGIQLSDTDYCVLGVQQTTLFCSQPQLSIEWLSTVPEVRYQQSGWLSIKSLQGQEYQGAYQKQYFRGLFMHPAWTTVALTTQSTVVDSLLSSYWKYLVLLALTLLLGVWLSLRFVHHPVTTLNKLIKGARNIAERNFIQLIDVQRKDEFGDLANSLNTMAKRLSTQFHTMDTLSHIDRLMLSKPDLWQVIDVTLHYLPDIVPCDVSAVFIVGAKDSKSLSATLCCYHLEDGRQRNSLQLPIELFAGLEAEPKPHFLSHLSDDFPFLQPLSDYGSQAFYVLPISYQERIAGAIVLGYVDSCATLRGDDEIAASDLADRIAVALGISRREQALYQQANYDELTGLANRQLLSSLLEQEIAHSRRNDCVLALLFIDLDDFKKVNDSIGHAAGDLLLKMAATRLQSCVREADTVARLGGDEFTIILPNLSSPRYARQVAEQIINSLVTPFLVYAQEHYIGASIGIAMFPDDGVRSSELLRCADTAMYRAKQSGRRQFMFFKEEMNTEAIERAQLERDLRQALKRGELILYFQPKLNVLADIIDSAEVLIRWQHPSRGLIGPDVFVSLAEDTGLIEAIGEWALRESCRQFRVWFEAGIQLNHLSVNVSGRQFKQQQFVDTVQNILNEYGVLPHQLELEITESVLMDDMANIEVVLQSLTNLGVKLAIDDFGTGYSSLSYLSRFSIDTLKIDRAFMFEVPADQKAKALVSSIVAMAHSLRKTVVIEGVETQLQMDYARHSCCAQVQGFYLSRPVPTGQFIDFLHHYNEEQMVASQHGIVSAQAHYDEVVSAP